MKTALKVASALTWFNLVWWGLGLVQSVPGLFRMGPGGTLCLVLLSSVPLHCYAGLQLHRSIRNSAVKLSSQAPVGIRFVGLAAQLCGLALIFVGLVLLGYAKEIISVVKEQHTQPDEMVKLFTDTKNVHAFGGFFLFLGLCISVCVFLNIRLLRWYYLVKQSDVS
ncbi:MAG: hypothetical protein JST68_01445 [Bacteroidetes bacterium]|nr:hypothetical protein [Bacteroidota bacterium]